MTVVTGRPKSVRNRCVIHVHVGVFCVVTLLFGFFFGCRGFCHWTESDLFLFLIPLEILFRVYKKTRLFRFRFPCKITAMILSIRYRDIAK